MAIALSYSRIKKAACPYLFNALYIDKRYQQPEGEPLIVGKVFAELVSVYRKRCLFKKITSDLEWGNSVEFERIPQEARPHATKILDMWAKFMASDMAILPEKPMWSTVEGQYAFDSDLRYVPMGWMKPETRFRIVVDYAYRQGDTIFIIDDKTGQPSEADPLQLEIYTYFLPLAYSCSTAPMNLPTLKRVVAIFNWVAARYKQTVCELEIDYQKFMVPQLAPPVRAAMLAKLEEVNSWTDFKPRECPECQYCHLPDCPLKIEAQKAIVPSGYQWPDKLASREHAEKLVWCLMEMEKLERRGKDLLRKFVEANGPVSSGGKIAKFTDKAEWRPNHRNIEFIRYLVGYGADLGNILDCFEIGATKLEDIIRHNPGLKSRHAMLIALGTLTAKVPSFGLYKDRL